MQFLSRVAHAPGEPLTGLATRVSTALQAAWVVVIEGCRTSAAEMHEFYDGLMRRLGTPAHEAEDMATGKLGSSIWTDVRYVRHLEEITFRCSKGPQPLHTDGAYVPNAGDLALMYCEVQAPSGGETLFLDGRQLVDMLAASSPKLLDKLRTKTFNFSKTGREKHSTVISSDSLGPRLCWNYYRVDTVGDADAQDIAEEFREFLETHAWHSNAVARVQLKPGEAVVWHDARVLHGRMGFSAHEDNDRLLWKAALSLAKG